MIDWQWLLKQVGAQAMSGTAGHSTTVSVLIVAILIILGIALFLFISLMVMRLFGTWRGRRFLPSAQRGEGTPRRPPRVSRTHSVLAPGATAVGNGGGAGGRGRGVRAAPGGGGA